MAPHILNIDAPTVEPSGAPSGDFEQIHTSPEMFGGFGAQVAEKFGTGLVQGGDAAINYLTETNQFQNLSRYVALQVRACGQGRKRSRWPTARLNRRSGRDSY
jgi:hypothetical protein